MKIAIIGKGMIGATCAFYLSKEDNISIDLFDDETLSGTHGAVGIVCPWVTQRRNKAWYHLVKEGAEFYSTLIEDMGNEHFIERTGAIITHPKQHDKLLKIALSRVDESPSMKEVYEITSHPDIPKDFKMDKGIYVSGAFRVDGKHYVESISQLMPSVNMIHETVNLQDIINKGYDKILVACGGRTQDILDNINIKLDHYPQKGMLIELPYEKNNSPIIMPPGELDFLFKHDALVIGASHEKEYPHLEFDQKIFDDLITQARAFMPIDTTGYITRIGLRSHNSKNLPFFGKVSDDSNVYCAAGLGSSGLTSGPYIGYLIAQHFIHNTALDEAYSVKQFIK